MKVKRINAGGMIFDVRPETSDEKAVDEVVVKKCYTRRWFGIEQGEHWLDLGANIGAFSCFASSLGAEVRGFDAEPNSAALAKHNVGLNGFRAQINHAAVVHDAYIGKMASLGVPNTDYGLWHHSICKPNFKNRISVPVVRISDLLSSGVDGIKMDIEGAEIDILYAIPDFFSVKKLCFEYHFDVNDSIPLFRFIVDRLKTFFPRVDARKTPETEKYTWFPPATVVFCGK